jgi:serine/threonine protein phosphatase PrpC
MDSNLIRCIQTEEAVHGITAYSVSVMGAGHEAVCEDCSGFRIGPKYSGFVVADGHSSAKQSFYGSQFAVDAFLTLIDDLNDKSFEEHDAIRFFRTREAYRVFLDRWYAQVCAREAKRISETDTAAGDVGEEERTRELLALPLKKRREVADAYGSTLLFCVACPETLIFGSIADGGIIVRRASAEGSEYLMENSLGSIVSTSVCDLDPGEVEHFFLLREEISAFSLMSDGLADAYDSCSIEDQIINMLDKCPFSVFCDKVEDFMVTKTRPFVDDDISLAFVSLKGAL